tara:strand:- start:15 stop:461 length:447 start_codon:yes stop_codon:yes gene_type:complete
MNKLLILFFIPIISFSQLDYNLKYVSSYAEFAIWNYETNNFEFSVEAGEPKYIFSPEKDYYTMQFNNNEPVKVNWIYDGKEDGEYAYFDELGSAIFITDDYSEIFMYYSYNEKTSQFEQVMVLSKIITMKREKLSETDKEYVPQTIKK